MKKTRLILILILVIVSAVLTSVSGQTSSSSTALSSAQPSATPTPPAKLPAIPDILKNPALLEMILAKLQSETEQKQLALQYADELKASREEWKSIANKEKDRADHLATATADRREESGSLRASIGYLQTSVSEYKTETDSLRRENNSLRGRQKWYFGAGALAAGTGCYVLNKK